MACAFCEYKGYITASFFANNNTHMSTRVCPKCNDLKAYSDYVHRKYSGVERTEAPPMGSVVGIHSYMSEEPLAIITAEGCKIINFQAYRKKLRGVQ